MSTLDDVSKAYDELAAKAGDEPDQPLDPDDGDPGLEAAPEADEPEPDAPAKPGERARDEEGKFARAKPDKPAKAAPPAKPAAPTAVAPLDPAIPPVDARPALKPPADWRPAAQAEWGKLPRAVQEEALRLHVETKKTLQERAEARQAADPYLRAVQPYEHMFRAAGKTPAEGVGWLVQSYAALNTAPLPQRAQIIGNLIRDHLGTDDNAISLLAGVLQGQPAQAQNAPQAIRPEQIPQMVRAEAVRMEQERQHQGEVKAISDFESSDPEFLSAVLPQMKAIVAVAKQEGQPITLDLLKSAHAQALRLNPETAAILKQRDDAEAAKKRTGDPARRAAAAGLRSEPAGSARPAKPKTIREQVAAAYDQLSSGQ